MGRISADLICITENKGGLIMFTTPCFIRKSTPELRKKLSDLGYSQVKQAIYYNHIMVGNGNIWSCQEAFNPQNPNGKGWKDCINCGTNEELFLAIAALRDDSDEEQYFTNGKEWRKLSKNIPWQQDLFTIECHKATVEELIEHFKAE